MDTPFGKFKLTANKASGGWALDDEGTMTSYDEVTTARSFIDVRKFVTNASNPKPKHTLPVEFSMAQHLHAKPLPTREMEAQPFANTNHVRRLEEQPAGLKVVTEAGKDKVEQQYTGKHAIRYATATPSTVEASTPKPKKVKGEPLPDWEPNTVTVSAETIPTDKKKVYSIREKGKLALGCKIDKKTGVVKIGPTPGTITARVSDGSTSQFDDVRVTITAP